MQNRIFTSKPQCRVTFYPQSFRSLGEPVILDTSTEDDIISVQTHKDTRAPVGHFTITLVPRGHQKRDALVGSNNPLDSSRYRDTLRPGDLVQIEMGPDRPELYPAIKDIIKNQGYGGLEIVMVGSIDEITETTSFNATDGKPERSITVTGRDLAKYLVDDQVWWDSWSQPQLALIKLAPEIDEWLRAKTEGGKPAGLVELLMKWMEQHFDLTFVFGPAEKPFTRRLMKDILRFNLSLNTPSIAVPMNLESFHGAPWAMMERAVCPPLFVLVADTRRVVDVNTIMGLQQGEIASNNTSNFLPSKWGKWESITTVMLYRNPWSNRYYSDWESLPTRVVTDSDLISREIGRSTAEISNTWRVWTESQGRFKTQGGGDISVANELRDRDSVQRYGERPLFVNTTFISGQGGATQQQLVNQFSFQVKDWNRWNEWLLSGRFVIKGRAAAKVGDRLWHWDEEFGQEIQGLFNGGADYYIEGVTQDFQAFSGWKTTLDVTRGQRHVLQGHGQKLDFTDFPLSAADLLHPTAAVREELRLQAQRIALWPVAA